MPLYYAPSVNNLQKTLNATYTTGAATITLNNTTNIQNKPGVIIINRVDINGALQSAASWTYISFTGTSGATLTGCTAISNDQDHATGQVVEFVPDVTWANALSTALANVVDTSTLAVDTTKIVTPSGTQTLTNKTITAPNITTIKVTTAYSKGNLGSSPTIDWSQGDLQTGTLTANCTFAFSNATAGQRLTFFALENGTGTYTISFTPTIIWQDNTTPTWTTTANKMNAFVIYYDGSNYYGMGAKFA